MTGLFILTGVCLAAIALWNLVPAVRERMRGWTTITEAAIAAALPFIGNAVDAFQDTDWKSYIPQETWPYVIGGLAAWFIFKRVVTTTAPGSPA